MMRKITLTVLSLLALALAGASVADAGNRGPHPVRGWKGNQFLFEVQPQGDVVHLVGYRAIGHRWERVGATSIARTQRAPSGGWLQQVWFHGQDLGRIEADLSNPWWRYYPGLESGGRWSR